MTATFLEVPARHVGPGSCTRVEVDIYPDPAGTGVILAVRGAARAPVRPADRPTGILRLPRRDDFGADQVSGYRRQFAAAVAAADGPVWTGLCSWCRGLGLDLARADQKV